MGSASPNWLRSASARIPQRVFRSIPGTDRSWAAPDSPLHNQANMKMTASIQTRGLKHRHALQEKAKDFAPLRDGPARHRGSCTGWEWRGKDSHRQRGEERKKKQTPTIWGLQAQTQRRGGTLPPAHPQVSSSPAV